MPPPTAGMWGLYQGVGRKFVPQDDGPLLIFELILNGCFAPALGWGFSRGLAGGLAGVCKQNMPLGVGNLTLLGGPNFKTTSLPRGTLTAA
jgi:hypothetical protein